MKRVYIDRNYLLVSEVVCDPDIEACFVRVCEEDCEEGEVDYYKIRTISAAEVPLCSPNEGACPEILCSELATCREEFCGENNVPENEQCSQISVDEESESGIASELESDSVSDMVEGEGKNDGD